MEKQRWEESENILKSQCEKHTTIFWKLRCRKSLRRCGRSKREKHSTLEALLDVQRHHTRLQLQHYTTSHYIQQLWVRWPLNHSKKHNSNHLSVHQQIRSPTHASQKFTLPMVSYLRNFRHRLVRYYWYCSHAGDIHIYICILFFLYTYRHKYIHKYLNEQINKYTNKLMHVELYIYMIIYVCVCACVWTLGYCIHEWAEIRLPML